MKLKVIINTFLSVWWYVLLTSTVAATNNDETNETCLNSANLYFDKLRSIINRFQVEGVLPDASVIFFRNTMVIRHM